MKVLYVDLETTGLDPETCQILQIGLLWDHNSTIPVDQLPQLEFLVRHDSYRGDPYALWLNAALLKRLSVKGAGVATINVSNMLSDFLNGCGIDPKDKILIGGKNVSGFDLPFLSKLPFFKGWSFPENFFDPHGPYYRFAHRTVDPAMMYARDTDDMPPNLDECLKRAGIPKQTGHTALDDCRLTCELVRKGFEIQKEHADAYAAQSEYRTTAAEPYTTAVLQDTLHKLLTKPPTAQNEGSTASETALQYMAKHGVLLDKDYPLPGPIKIGECFGQTYPADGPKPQFIHPPTAPGEDVPF